MVYLTATRHGFRSQYYADDSQLYISCSPDEAPQSRTRERTIKCIADIKAFMRSNRLRFNLTKTEFLWCATARRRHQLNLEPIHIDAVDIAPSANVRNLGVMMDGDFSMTTTHVKNISPILFPLTSPDSSHSQKRTPKCSSAVSSALELITATQSLLAYQDLLITISTPSYMLRLV